MPTTIFLPLAEKKQYPEEEVVRLRVPSDRDQRHRATDPAVVVFGVWSSGVCGADVPVQRRQWRCRVCCLVCWLVVLVRLGRCVCRGGGRRRSCHHSFKNAEYMFER